MGCAKMMKRPSFYSSTVPFDVVRVYRSLGTLSGCSQILVSLRPDPYLWLPHKLPTEYDGDGRSETTQIQEVAGSRSLLGGKASGQPMKDADVEASHRRGKCNLLHRSSDATAMPGEWRCSDAPSRTPDELDDVLDPEPSVGASTTRCEDGIGNDVDAQGRQHCFGAERGSSRSLNSVRSQNVSRAVEQPKRKFNKERRCSAPDSGRTPFSFFLVFYFPLSKVGIEYRWHCHSGSRQR